MGQANSFKHPDEVPADVGLIPTKSEARGAGVGVMVLMPVFAPSRQLERAKPPDVHAGVAVLDMIEMRKAVHQALHVQRVDQADGTHPEETHPAEAENQTDEDGKDDDRRFRPAPDLVDTAGEFRRPTLLVGGLRLIEPAQMRPPKPALLGTGDVFWRIGDGMMEAMIGHPARRMAGAIENGPEDQYLLDEPVGLERLVSQHAVIADGCAAAAQGDAEHSHADNLEAGQRKQDQPDDCENMDQQEIGEDAFFAVDGLPEGPVPRALLSRYD